MVRCHVTPYSSNEDMEVAGISGSSRHSDCLSPLSINPSPNPSSSSSQESTASVGEVASSMVQEGRMRRKKKAFREVIDLTGEELGLTDCIGTQV